MRVFVTGASGWIGSAVVPELLAAGHEVVGLARSDASAAAIEAAGAEVRRGGLDDLSVLKEAAAASDGVVHLAFNHELAFSGDFVGAANADRAAVGVFGDVLAGSDRPLVIASGVGLITTGQLITERDGHDQGRGPEGPSTRLATAEFTLALADRGVRSSILRLPPTVHGDGDHGFMATLVGIARDKGVSGYIGNGANRWPAVHRLDAAPLCVSALEAAPAGSTLHAIADEGVPTREIAEVIGRHLNVPVASIAQEEAAAHFTWLAHFFGMDLPSSSALTRELFAWEPTHAGLLEDLEEGHYFSR